MVGISLKNWAALSAISPIVFVLPAYAADYLTESQAQKVLFPTATEFTKKPITLNDDQVSKVKEIAGVRQRNKSLQVWQATLKGKTLGWFYIDEVVGKHEFITYATAVSPEGVVLGIEILSYRETHGGEVRDEVWRKKFKGKTLADRFKLDQDVPNITGATLSSRNVLDGVKRILALQKVLSDEKLL